MVHKKHYLSISQSGAVADRVLIQPGVTVLSGSDNKLDKYVRITLHEVDLALDAAGTVEFKIGNYSIFKRELSTSGEIHALDRDMAIMEYHGDQQPLTLTVTGSANITGFIRWNFEWAGGNVVKKIQDTYGV